MRRAPALAVLASGFTLVAGLSCWLAVAAFHPQERPPAAVTTAPAEPAVAVVAAPEPVVAVATAWEPHPACARPLTLLDYPHFRLGYDEEARNPGWVAYPLDGPIAFGGHEVRPTGFATELRTAARVAHRDYSNSGFDRGHLCPAFAVFSRFGAEAMAGTFVMSNVVPQYHGLNAGEWEQLESAIAGRPGSGHGWAGRYGPVWIINGPLYGVRPATARLEKGPWVPTACFSVVLRRVGGRWDALAFAMPNTPTVAGPFARWLTTIANVAHDSGIDLLAGLPADEKARLGALRATAPWP